jgi:hypothetical protein
MIEIHNFSNNPYLVTTSDKLSETPIGERKNTPLRHEFQRQPATTTTKKVTSPGPPAAGTKEGPGLFHVPGIGKERAGREFRRKQRRQTIRPADANIKFQKAFPFSIFFQGFEDLLKNSVLVHTIFDRKTAWRLDGFWVGHVCRG